MCVRKHVFIKNVRVETNIFLCWFNFGTHIAKSALYEPLKKPAVHLKNSCHKFTYLQLQIRQINVYFPSCAQQDVIAKNTSASNAFL